jgi:hypothetical protein
MRELTAKEILALPICGGVTTLSSVHVSATVPASSGGGGGGGPNARTSQMHAPSPYQGPVTNYLQLAKDAAAVIFDVLTGKATSNNQSFVNACHALGMTGSFTDSNWVGQAYQTACDTGAQTLENGNAWEDFVIQCQSNGYAATGNIQNPSSWKCIPSNGPSTPSG